MRKTILIYSIVTVCLFLTGILLAVRAPLYWVILLTLISCGLAVAGLIFDWKEQKLMQFLIQDNKKKSVSTVHWDEEELNKLHLLQRRVELSSLQSQINPHFLYNTLDSIRSKALLDGQEEIASMTEILSRFFRYCISNDGALVKVREEVKHINDYYYIQKYRFEDRMSMELIMEEDEIQELYLPKMTLQPLVENAMIHGLEKLARQGVVTIRLFATEKKLLISIADNGAGMEHDELRRLNEKMESQLFDAEKKGKRHNGIALTNVNTRIKLTFGKEYGIHYRSKLGSGTEGLITLPRIDEFGRVKYENILDRGKV